MGIVDSKTGKEVLRLEGKALEDAARELRAYALTAITAAGSGHPGGSLSQMDITAALLLNKMRHDPKNPKWENRDRLFLSKAHCVPALYAALGKAGYFPIDEMVTLRKLGSPFQGHCDWKKCTGIEMSGGSLGQGLGIAVGDAIAAKLDGRKNRVYCIMGDGEQDEGSIWEAVMSASNFKLDNLTAIVDKNRLQIDGWTKDVMDIDPLAEKYRAFGWHAIELGGHDMNALLKAFDEAEKVKGKPTVLVAHTVKGKGVSFMENLAGWHGKAPNKDELMRALKDLGMEKFPAEKLLKAAEEAQKKIDAKVNSEMPKFRRNYWWNTAKNMQAEMKPSRFGWGETLAAIGSDPRIVTLHADISNSITITKFEENNPERRNRVFSVGIAEQNMMCVAAGLAKEGKIPITGTYGVFASGRPWDQIRTTICYGNLNVKIGGAHGGISVGPDGATHQSLEEITIMAILPNMHLFVPCDAAETAKATRHSTLEINGPCYVRFAREATPVVTNEKTPWEYGKANVIRYRGEKDKFADAFETVLAHKYKNEKEDITIIACGPMVPEAMRAAWILKEEFGVETRVLNVHTVKPLDEAAIILAAEETGAVLAAEEHQTGGFGNIVAGAIAKNMKFRDNFIMDMLGVNDRFGESGAPWELIKHFGLSAEHIAEKAKKLVSKKK
ncbi:MAG: transketolase [Candidatus Diapherotrites archaeon]